MTITPFQDDDLQALGNLIVAHLNEAYAPFAVAGEVAVRKGPFLYNELQVPLSDYPVLLLFWEEASTSQSGKDYKGVIQYVIDFSNRSFPGYRLYYNWAELVISQCLLSYANDSGNCIMIDENVRIESEVIQVGFEDRGKSYRALALQVKFPFTRPVSPP